MGASKQLLEPVEPGGLSLTQRAAADDAGVSRRGQRATGRVWEGLRPLQRGRATSTFCGR